MAWASKLATALGAAVICFMSSAANNFAAVELPHHVHIELPSNWTALSDSKRTTLAAYAQAQSERLGASEAAVEMPFAASLYDDAGNVAATANVRYYPTMALGQSDAKRASEKEIAELDQSLQKTVIPGAESSGQRVLAWRGTKRVVVAGLTAFVSEYRVSSSNGGPFVIRLVRILNLSDSFTLILSYREENVLLEPIIGRVIQTLRVGS